jgi:hypothetical protein
MKKKRNRTGSSIDGAVEGAATAIPPSSEGGSGAKNDRKVASRDDPDLERGDESGSSEKEKITPEIGSSLSGAGKAPPIPGASPDSKAVAAAKPKEESKLGSGNAKSQPPPRDYNPRWKGYVYILLVRASS